MAPWNSTDMSHKLDADRKEQAKRLSDLNDAKARSSHIDELLTVNQTILKISQNQLKIVQDGSMDLARQINDTNGKLHQAEKDRVEKKKALESATAQAKETADLVVKANSVLLHALRDVDEKRTAYNTAEAAEKTAQDHLDDVVITDAQGVPAAQHNVEDKENILASAKNALDEALHQRDAKQQALTLARTAASTASKELSNATSDYHDALAEVSVLKKVLEGLKKQDEGPQNTIRLLEKAVEKQEAIVNSLANQSKALHAEVATKEKGYKEISATVEKDTECIDRLKRDETQLTLSTHRFKLTAAAYEAANEGDKQQMFGALWKIKDEKDHDTYALTKAQEDCAPKDVKIPDRPPPIPCVPVTKGSCYILPCKSWRNASCDEKSECVCAPGTCASSDGETCVRRESPVFLASPSTELPAEPAAASAFFLAAAALMMAAFLVVRRRRASNIRIPDSILG
jgi:hypothetical protein